jgi:hypothetical protein
MKDSILDNRFYRYFLAPKWGSLLCTTIFFIIYLFLFRPGYGINDDLQMISLVAGYPGGNPAPFIVHSNVLIGLILAPLYAFHTMINWEVLFFVGLNFISVWAFLNIIFSLATQPRQKLFGVATILACDAYFILNITYTTIAAFACLSGVFLLLAASRSSTTLKKGNIALGTALVLMGSLLRFEMLPLSLSITLPAVLFSRRSFNIKNFLMAWIAPFLFVAAGYVFNRVYLHFSPEWHAYNMYDQTRVLIDDTHRLENMHSEIHFIGWSGNDQELFGRWFFPDRRIYSLGHLQYLVKNISGVSTNLYGSALAFFNQLISPGLIPYILILISTCLWTQSYGLLKKASLPLLAIGLMFLADNLYLAWAWKIADRTIYFSVLALVISGMLFVNWLGEREPNSAATTVQKTGISRFTFYGSVLVLILALGLILNQSILTTSNNINKQSAYQQIRGELGALQTAGIISENTLIISPAHGLPMEWSNPFVLAFPSTQYLETGWATFSPFYEQVLREFNIQSLPDALYQKNNVYLMTQSSFTAFLGRYYQEHENISVVFQPIYTMPNSFNFPFYNNVQLYKVVKQ